MPTRHGAPSGRPPHARTSPPRLHEAVRDARARSRSSRRGRPRTPCRCRRSRSPCRARGSRTVRSSHATSASRPARAARRSRAASGTRGGSRLKSHARRSTPDVMSKRPLRRGVAARRRSAAAPRSRRRSRRAAPPAARLIARHEARVAVARVLRLDALDVGDRRVGGARARASSSSAPSDELACVDAIARNDRTSVERASRARARPAARTSC